MAIAWQGQRRWRPWRRRWRPIPSLIFTNAWSPISFAKAAYHQQGLCAYARAHTHHLCTHSQIICGYQSTINQCQTMCKRIGYYILVLSMCGSWRHGFQKAPASAGCSFNSFPLPPLLVLAFRAVDKTYMTVNMKFMLWHGIGQNENWLWPSTNRRSLMHLPSAGYTCMVSGMHMHKCFSVYIQFVFAPLR